MKPVLSIKINSILLIDSLTIITIYLYLLIYLIIKKIWKLMPNGTFLLQHTVKLHAIGLGEWLNEMLFVRVHKTPSRKKIIGAKSLFELANTYFKSIHFEFFTKKEHEIHSQKLKKRFAKAKTIKNTRQFHRFDILLAPFSVMGQEC